MSVEHVKQQATEIWSNIQYEVDGGIGTRAHIGMVVICNDQTLSHEARAMLTIPGIALYESRIGRGSSPEQRKKPLSIGLLEETFDGLDEAIQQINTMRRSDVVALGCTSAAMVIGPQELERRVRNVHPEARVTDPFAAILSALRALGSARVGFVSPYPRQIAEKMIRGIETAGVKVPIAATFHNATGLVRNEAPFISPVSISNAVRQVSDSADLDTVVIACTQMRAAAIINELEHQTGKLIISSNQAICWHALRLAECRDVIGGWGRLFERDLQQS
ncbi:hypothetical protein IVB18_41725 [Bradyrhizobium sp. 186]|uniref:maleate cis-trans isomerase family protein n=1 Tax=Bradyrhizobium sp. 186 TaxID=2782654 RepID=UPI0020015B20|nr:hypothetical protein [Bradyrhizobium sp. 186]UPK34516.1 hypothetical protein IVB18_41725 [Bradyrhizobium sp. 186]